MMNKYNFFCRFSVMFEKYVTDPCESRRIILAISRYVDGLAPEPLEQGGLHPRPVPADDAVDVD